jgi:hypothetical protein
MPSELHGHLYTIANKTSDYCNRRADEHHLQARTWSSVNRWLTLPAAVLAGAAGTALLTDSTNQTAVLIAGGVALIVAALTAASHALGPDALASQHKKGYDGFSSLGTRFEMFRDCTLEMNRSNEELTTELNDLLTTRDKLAATVPETSMRARKKVGARAGSAPRSDKCEAAI